MVNLECQIWSVAYGGHFGRVFNRLATSP